MTGRRTGEGRRIPSPIPDDVMDWVRAVGELKSRGIKPRSIAAHKPSEAVKVPAASTWERVLDAKTLPSREQLNVLLGYLGSIERLAAEYPAAHRERLEAVWTKADTCLTERPTAGSAPKPPKAATTAAEGPGSTQQSERQAPSDSGRTRMGGEAVADFHAPLWGIRANIKGPAWMILCSIVVVAVAITAVVLLSRTEGTGSDGQRPGLPAADMPSWGGAPPSPQAASPSASGVPNSPGTGRLRPAAASEPPGLEKDSLGADSRCSPPNSGPGSVKWRVCTRVQADRISFALEITNRGTGPATVKARLKYTAQTSDFRTCPGVADLQMLTIPASQTLTTDTAQCSVPRTSSPTAYTGVGWVVAPDADYGTRVLSPGAHVYPGEIHWTPDVL